MKSGFAPSFYTAVLGLLHAVMAVSQTPLLNTPPPTWSELNPVTSLTAETFSHPPARDRPWVRMNTPDNITPEELKTEIAEMKNSGIGGVEIGQGTFPRTPQLIAILQAANEAGLKVSLSHGSTVSPAGYSLNEDNVRKTLLFAASQVSAGQAAASP
jgi:hypothetical protein